MYFLTAVCAWRGCVPAWFTLPRTVALGGVWLLNDVEKPPFDEDAECAVDARACARDFSALIGGFEK